MFRKLTVEESVRAVLELQVDADRRPLRRAEIAERLDALLADWQIANLRTNTALSLSGGNAAASRLRVHCPRVLASFCSMNHLPASIQ